jgi:hypothetical protein
MENVLFKISYPGGVSRADRRGSGDEAAFAAARGAMGKNRR